MRSWTWLCDTKGECPKWEAGRAASSPRAAEGVGRMEGGAAGAAKALGASVSPGGVEAGEGTTARPVGLEAGGGVGLFRVGPADRLLSRRIGHSAVRPEGPCPRRRAWQTALCLLSLGFSYCDSSGTTFLLLTAAVYRLGTAVEVVQLLICGWGWGWGTGGCSRFLGMGVGTAGAALISCNLAQVSWQAAALPAFA